MTIDAYPLAWPAQWPRTPRIRRQSGTFKVSFAKARDDLIDELAMMSGRNVVVSSNIPIRRDGLPYANTKPPDDPAVAVYFTRRGEDHCIPCDKYRSVRDNLRAIGLTVHNLRGIERYGTGGMMDASFRGFLAIPEKTGGVAWWDVLGLPSDAPWPDVKQAFRELVRIAHPDAGGQDDEFYLRVVAAYEMARQERLGDQR